jgi:formamidopyrimidine-DNA glycosylase
MGAGPTAGYYLRTEQEVRVPETPDVEVYKQYIDATSLHQTITSVGVGDERLLDGVEASELRTALRGRSLDSTYRVGKYLFSRLSDTRYLLLHFGMTGEVKYYKSMGDTPDYTQLRLDFENGYHLAYVNKRILGRISVVDDADRYLADHDIGPDAANLDYEDFARIVSGGRGAVKTTLMNQKLLSGLGNVYTDEILFQSGIHPKSVGRRLPEEKLDDLYRAMQTVVVAATEAGAKPDQLPESFLLRHREEGATFQGCEEVIKEQVSGRSCYFCPSRQKKYE